MKKTVAGVLFIGATLFGADYTNMSLDDLSLQKGSIPEADREAFKSSMQTKVNALTPDERDNMKKENGMNEQSIKRQNGQKQQSGKGKKQTLY